ncbi:zinc finger CCCH domain-containing protein 55-like isoform X2 [Primulina eburnea]|uniref:zinc finger CCCH domain-containing protein 55-like isoform X2 n=1 Tax=Primulina eburnea TaxID=1245227 RepID=UPI003C6C1593
MNFPQWHEFEGISWFKFLMSERKKLKSFWDMEEEAKHPSSMNIPNSWSGKKHHCNYDDRHYHGLSSSGTSSIKKSLDNSGRVSWETNEENPTILMGDGFVKRRQDASEVKEIGGVSRFFKNMSPGFDGMEMRNCNSSFEDDRSHSRRFPARGRSRSRGRTSGRSRSRSLSRGRGRERERGRGWSRSRSRSNDSARGLSRSRSPIEDYRRQSYGWSDRSRGPDKSSQNCRDFVAGSCRRGSQCRFLHPSNVSHRDGDRLEDGPAESWRNKVDRIRTSKHAYSRGPESEMQDDDSEPNRRKDEQFLTKNRIAFPCKDFMRGNCRWADSCRFSHHSASGESFGRSCSVRSFDKDSGHQSNRYEKPICKFFAAGECFRNNCRFSHEVIKKGSLHDNCNWSDDAIRVSDAVNTVGWGEKNVAETKSTGDFSNEMGNGMENEDKTWGVLDWKDRLLNREKQTSPPRESNSHDLDIGYNEYMVKASGANKLEQLILLNSQLQNQEEFLNIQQQNSLHGHHSFSVKALQQNTSPTSHIQQQHPEMLQNDTVNQFVSGVLDGVKNSQKTTHPDFFSGQSLNEKGERMFLGHYSISNEAIRGRNMLYHMPSNEVVNDLNMPERKIVVPLNSQADMQNHQKAIKSPKMSESKVLQFFPNLLTNEHSNRVTNSPIVIPDQSVVHVTENPAIFLGQRFVNEQAQAYQSIDPSNSSGVIPFLSDTGVGVHTPLVNTMNAQMSPVTVSRDMFNPLENGTDVGELSSRRLVPRTEQNNQIHMKQSSPLSVGMEVDNLKVNHQENVTVKQDEVTAKPENEALGEQSKDDKENKASETLDGHGKNERGNATKDEKRMRLFKNSLVEFVKEILKPTRKEGRMSREAHKTVVKKVVDKVTGTIQADHVPKTQEKIEHYLSCSKPKITKLVQAYVERCRKVES